jgi:hypothetical protein
MRYHDTMRKSFDNKGNSLKVYNDNNFGVGSQLLFLDEKENRYYPLQIKGTYELVERDCRIVTDKNGFILEISQANRKPIKAKQEFKSESGNSKYYKLFTN